MLNQHLSVWLILHLHRLHRHLKTKMAYELKSALIFSI
jgi:hypothetical protein